tara:strand:- start:24 stop:758 length:735 start_codon:yes stop_codon:yes gene_type:complete
MFVLNNRKELKPGKTWTDDNGVRHPGNWASVWSDDVKASYGIKEVSVQTKPDNKFYLVGQRNLDGSWSSKPRNTDDVKEVDKDGNAILDADGNQIITLGLKSQWVNRTKEKANSLLAPTDWQVIAKAERDRAIDSDVATYRAAVITACTAIEKAITDITDTAIPSNLATIQAKDEEDKTDADKKVVSDYEAEVATKFTAFKTLFDAPTKTTKVTKTSVSGEEYEVEVVERTGEPAPIYDWPDSI